MKVLRICPEMPAFANLGLRKLENLSFGELTDFYRKENLIFPGGWKDTAFELGNDVVEIVYADHFSQTLWLRENFPSAKLAEAFDLDRILLKQVEYYEPDLVIYYTGVMYRLSSELRRQIKNKLKPSALCLAIWGDEIPAGVRAEDFFSSVDCIGACTTGYQKYFRSIGLNSFLIESAFDEKFEFQTKKSTKSDDVVFIGNSGFGEPDHQKRYEFLNDLLALNKNVAFYGFEKKSGVWNNSLVIFFTVFTIRLLSFFHPKILNVFGRVFGRLQPKLRFLFVLAQHAKITKAKNKLIKRWIRFEKYSFGTKPVSKRFRKKYRGELQSGADYFAKLSSAKIAINFHRDEANDFGNIRCFETMGVGTLLLTDRARDMAHLFDEDEFVGFETVQECSEKINWLLKNPKKMEEIAKKGQQKVLDVHTLRNRLKALFHFVEINRQSVANAKVSQIDDDDLVIIYDAGKRPISFDYAFFLQYCHITMNRYHPGKKLRVFIAMPANADDYSERYFWSFDQMQSRIENIFLALHRYFPDIEAQVIHVGGDVLAAKDTFVSKNSNELVPLEEQPHHREFYTVVNDYPSGIQPLAATKKNKARASRLITDLKKSFAKVFSITVRNSIQFPERNSNIAALQIFASKCAKENIGLVIIPDADNRSDVDWPDNVTLIDETAIRDFDYRMAIYECCDDNVFVNNGPCVASELNPNIKSKMFKLVVPSVPHCTVEFIESQGYRAGQSPAYNVNSKWIWQDDDIELLIEHLI